MSKLAPIFFVILFLLHPSSLFACPLANNLIDFNCDGIHKIVVTGDSIVYGKGDLLNKNRGGYVLRLKRKLKKSTVVNLGFPGFSTERLYQKLKMDLSTKSTSKIKASARDADILIIDIGRNDFFSDVTPGYTVRNIKRLVKFLRRVFNKNKRSSPPYIVVATLLPTTRGFQREFIAGVNEILYTLTSPDLPVGLFFDTLPEELISSDGIHPESEGYKILFDTAYQQITGQIQNDSLTQRPDGDDDGIYDRFERTKYKTDFNLIDTDGDQLGDGEEVFTYLTDPLNPDTDGDGISDGQEIDDFTDPLNP